jgi:hypothetical protein
VISAGGGNIIAAGGGNIIAAGGGNVISAGGGNYRVFEAASDDAELPVLGAVVVLRDPVTRKRIQWIKPVTTDEKGQFKFEKLPARMNYLVEVVFVTKDQKPFRMLTLARPAKTAPAPTQVSWRSMAVVTSMLDKAAEAKGLYVANPAKLVAAEEKLKKAFDGLTRDQRAERLRKAILVPGATSRLEVPDQLSLQAVAETKTVIDEAVSQTPELKTEMTTMTSTVTAVPSTDDLEVVSAATTVMTTTTQPTLTQDLIVVDTTSTASPSPSPLTLVSRTSTTTTSTDLTREAVVASPSPTPTPALSTIPITTVSRTGTIVVASPTPTPTPSTALSTNTVCRTCTSTTPIRIGP